MTEPGPASDAVTVRRIDERAAYDAATRDAILDAAIIAHVGLVGTDSRPIVIPMAYARDDETLLLHGSQASRLLRSGKAGTDLCVTVTLLDGMVLARSTLHHSMNYRSVVVLGRAVPVEDLDERAAALDLLVEHLTPGQVAALRPSTEKELRSTLVLRLPLEEFSVKLREGGPVDDEEDLDPQIWAGVLPLRTEVGEPVPDEITAVGIPAHLAGWNRIR
ncbi:MAG: pyridoxamine 5'-phosphate oxidase family protein [Actinomycetota bacterium]